jgi:hypothetical protein
MTYRTSTMLFAATLALAPAAFASTAPASATAELSQLAAGEPGQLSIRVDDTASPPDVKIAGASVRYSGQMSQMTIINGSPSQATTFMYTVVPAHAGPLDVPAIAVATEHGTARTAPLHATVEAASASAPTAPRMSSAQSMPGASARADGAHAFVRLDVPQKRLYVGQAVPVKIRAYFRGGTAATLEGQPRVDSDAFTLSQLSDKPAQTEVELRGERYLQVTWTGVLSPAKPHAGALGVTLPVELAYRVHQEHPHRTLRDVFGGDPFAGDPFADSFLDQEDPFEDMLDEGEVQHQHVDLRGSAGAIEVSELPVDGRPAGFTGAVGTFALAVDPPAGDARVGEPVTLTARVTGTGNFDRVALAGVPRSSELETYDLKSTWEPGATPLTGTKTFTQTLVPRKPGELAVPSLELAYFDPAKRAYETVHTQPFTLRVAPGTTEPGLSATVANPAMRPNVLATGPVHATLEPLVRRPVFWALPGSLALATALLAGAGAWRRSARRASRARGLDVDRAVDAAALQMREAASRRDAPAFFAAARTAVQQRLGAAWGIAPEAVTPADIRARIPGSSELVALLEHADRVTYTGTGAHESLDRWLALAERELAHLEAA